MWHADVTDVAARTRGIDRLHHRFLRANTLQYRIGSDSFGQLLDPRNAFIASLNHNVSCTKFAGEFLTRRVTAHRDDPLGTHLFCGKHSQKADCAVTHDNDGATRLHVRSIRSKPAGAQNVGCR